MRRFVSFAALWAFAALAAAQLQSSEDGQCGPGTGKTCYGSDYGQCCSEHGWCGGSEEHCAVGCQLSYGFCDPFSGLADGTPASTIRAK